jgi:hypothetical protein
MADDTAPEEPIAVPKWDVALEALIKEEYGELGRLLTLDDYRRLAQQYTWLPCLNCVFRANGNIRKPASPERSRDNCCSV